MSVGSGEFNGTPMIPGFQLGGESDETHALALTGAALAGELAMTFNLHGSTNNIDDLRCDPLVMLGARATVAFLYLTGRLDSDAMVRLPDDGNAFDLIIQDTVDTANRQRLERREKTEYEGEYKCTFYAEPGKPFVYPDAESFEDLHNEIINAEVERAYGPDEGDEVINEADGITPREYLRRELWHGWDAREQAQRQHVLSKLAGWIRLMANEQEPASTEVPSQTDHNWRDKMSDARQTVFFAKMDLLYPLDAVGEEGMK